MNRLDRAMWPGESRTGRAGLGSAVGALAKSGALAHDLYSPSRRDGWRLTPYSPVGGLGRNPLRETLSRAAPVRPLYNLPIACEIRHMGLSPVDRGMGGVIMARTEPVALPERMVNTVRTKDTWKGSIVGSAPTMDGDVVVMIRLSHDPSRCVEVRVPLGQWDDTLRSNLANSVRLTRRYSRVIGRRPAHSTA